MGGRNVLPDDRLSSSGTEHVASAFHALAEPRRLYAIRYLSSFNPGAEVDLQRIGKSVAGQERDIAPEDVDNPAYRSVREALHSHHLPALDQCGAIEYGGDRTPVTVRPELRFYSATVSLVATWIQFE